MVSSWVTQVMGVLVAVEDAPELVLELVLALLSDQLGLEALPVCCRAYWLT